MKRLATELEQFFEPKVFKLQREYAKERNKEPLYFTMKIIDDDLDPYECILHFYEENIRINTEGYTHINLTVRHLKNLINAINEVKKIERNDVEYKEWEKKKENKKYIDEL
jgi:hypothetical protein